MKLNILGSSSSGNCYIFTASTGERLIIECGVQFEKIKRGMNFSLRNSFCILTHSHQDHCKSISNLLHMGIKVWASNGTHEACNTLNHQNAQIAVSGLEFTYNGFTVMPFDVKHDVPEPLNFLIYHPECGTFPFITDTFICEYKFPRTNNWLIEANYSQEIIDKKLLNDKKFLRDRVIASHLELKTTLGILKANDLSLVNNIVLLHLSDSNSNAADFKKEVERATGKYVHIADTGMEIPFYKTPF
jgi:phosphoribosyl 1,2-cyclic phosphodiesterase